MYTKCEKCFASVISENIGNLLIFREKVLDLSPKSVGVVEMTLYFSLDMYKVKKKRCSCLIDFN